MSKIPTGKTYSSSVHPRPLRNLYPAIEPYSQGFLQVDEIHTLYWEQSGNPDGVPILFIHGGPGGGTSPHHRCFFDPAHYRIILFDQRGAGRSTPLACTINNTLELLVSDIEQLRAHLKISKWHIFGGSWGSTLALSYAIKHSDPCLSLILRGIFLMEQSEVDWFFNGMRYIFPEAFDEFAGTLTDPQKLFEHYYALLNSDDPDIVMQAALKWSAYESACASFIPALDHLVNPNAREQALAVARIEAHYFKHNCMSPEDSILLQIDKIRHIPAIIIQGRYDIVCPIETAHKLHLAWPEADYVIVPDGGHSSADPPIRSRLIEATDHARYMR